MFGPLLVLLVSFLGTSASAAEKVAVIDLASPGLPLASGKALSDNLVGIIAAETTKLGYKVISTADINAMLSLEKQKDLLGCTDATCLADIGGALGVQLMVSGSVGRVGEEYSLSLSLVDIVKADVRQRFQGTAGTEAMLPATTRRAVQFLFGKAADLSGTAMVVARTLPAGGTVFLDGKRVGVEPATLEDVAAGDHLLTAELGGLKGSMSLAVESGAVQRVTIELKGSPPVKLKVVSTPPDGRVFIDDKEVGKTPLVVPDVPTGERRIRVELEHHLPYEETRTLSYAEFERNGGAPFRLDATLTPRLHLFSFPVVLVAGVTSGATILKQGVTTHVELGIEPTRWLELTLGYVHPQAGILTGRLFVYRGLVEAGLLVRLAAFARVPNFDFRDFSFGGGVSLGKAVDTAWGSVGMRLEAVMTSDLTAYAGAGPTFPVALVGFWRI